MDRAISASEANQQFSRVLREVAEGESYTVTSRGKPVARIVPVEAPSSQAPGLQTLLEEWRKEPIRVIGPWKREDLYDWPV
jgi:prevent-host-death family protein